MKIENIPMVRVTWLDARDTETGWLDIKEIINAPLAVCQEGWLKKIEYLTVSYSEK